jgi:hypothetical protein
LFEGYGLQAVHNCGVMNPALAAEVRFFEMADTVFAEPTHLKRSPFFSLGAKQLRGTQNEDGEQGDIKGCQHFHLRAVESNGV